MIKTEILINEESMLKEVRRLTSYAGAKTADDEGAYDRKSATKQDADMLQLWWREALTKLQDVLKPFVTSVVNDDTVKIELAMSSSWDATLAESLNMSAGSYVVNYVAGKWLEMTEGKQNDYNVEALSLLNDVLSKIYYKKKPTRVSPV
ncbi:MAG: hypothetical protein ACI4T5_03240 [Prevotella sp.]